MVHLILLARSKPEVLFPVVERVLVTVINNQTLRKPHDELLNISAAVRHMASTREMPANATEYREVLVVDESALSMAPTTAQRDCFHVGHDSSCNHAVNNKDCKGTCT